MKKVFLLLLVCLIYSVGYAQTCEELLDEYQQLDAQYNHQSTAKKRESLKQMERILKLEKEMGCGFPQRFYTTLRERRATFAPKTIFEKSDYPLEYNTDFVTIGLKQKKKVRLVSHPEWVEAFVTESNEGFTLSVNENTLPYVRTGIVEVSDGKKTYQCTLTQEAAPLLANVTERLGFGQNGGTAYVYVETNDTAWTISGDNKWVSVTPNALGAMVVCQSNPNKSKRSHQLKVRLACGTTRTVDVSQAIGRTTLSVPVKSLVFANSGESNNAVVQCNYDQWSASADANWVTVRKRYGGISIACAPNNMAATRTARVKIETNDRDHLVEYITVTQKEAAAYLRAERETVNSDGNERSYLLSVETNIPDWQVNIPSGSSWLTARRKGDNLQLWLNRNDRNYSRSSEVVLSGKGKTYTVRVTQPNRGYAGLYEDYYAANGDWHLTYFTADLHLGGCIGTNLSALDIRWKPVELSLLNLNLEYRFGGYADVAWEPVIRGYVPFTRDGQWAAYAGIGAHISFVDEHAFLFEAGTKVQWNSTSSSRIFFKYNGSFSFGMSYDMGTWF